jgi:signal transduction histidine kinase
VPDAVASALLHMTREALANVVKHAHATEVQVQLTYAAPGVHLTISDDGQGFTPGGAPEAGHHGLRNLHSRAAEIGATLRIASQVGAGTTITVHAPGPPPEAPLTEESRATNPDPS